MADNVLVVLFLWYTGMKTDQFTISITGEKGVYDCKVEAHKEQKETYYMIDIETPTPHDDGEKITPREYLIEMRLDCETGNFKIKPYFKNLPDELLGIEMTLSDALCGLGQ